MDKKEFAVIAAALQTYYPRFSLIPNEQAMELWYDGLKDIPADVASAGLKKWVMTEKWPPTIAELRKQCSELVTGVRPDWGEGWMEVQKAIRLYGYMRGDEALASMSAITRETVRRIGWQAICESESPCRYVHKLFNANDVISQLVLIFDANIGIITEKSK